MDNSKKIGNTTWSDLDLPLRLPNTSDDSTTNNSLLGSYKRNGSQGLRSPVVKRLMSAPVDIQGWLYKQGGLMLWKKRWFVLSQYCLFYYKGPEEEKLLGSILLPSYHISECKDKMGRKFAFKAEHVNMRTYHFAADSRESMNQWITSLKSASLLQDLSNEISKTESTNENLFLMPESSLELNLNMDMESYLNCMRSFDNDRLDDKYGSNFNSEERLEEPLYKCFSDNMSQMTPSTNVNQMCTTQIELHHSKPCCLVPQSYDHRQQKLHIHPQNQYSGLIRNQSAMSGNSRSQHVYVNAPPKPKRLTDVSMNASIYDDYSQFTHESYLNINLENTESSYSSQLALKSTDPTKEDASNVLYQPSQRRTPDTYGRNTIQKVPQNDKDYEHIYYGFISVQKPMNSAESCQKSKPMNNESSTNYYSPPRPHSADFLDYEIGENSRQDSNLHLQSQPQRPKSSIDINSENKTNNNEGFFYSEERYAAQMRQSSVYFHRTPQYNQYQRNQSLSSTSTPLQLKTKNFCEYEELQTGLCLHSKTSEMAMNETTKSIKKENEYMQLVTNKNELIPHHNESSSTVNNDDLKYCLNYGTHSNDKNWNYRQFARSASARLPKNCYSHIDHFFNSDSEKNSRDQERRIHQREESMKRLLEWKQRMLQSPLTRKPSERTNKNDISTCYKRQAFLDLVAHEASIEALQFKQRDDYHFDNENLDDNRQCSPHVSKCSSYSSDEEPIDDKWKLKHRSISRSLQSVDGEINQIFITSDDESLLLIPNPRYDGKIDKPNSTNERILSISDYEERVYRPIQSANDIIENGNKIKNTPLLSCSQRSLKTKNHLSLYDASNKKNFSSENIYKDQQILTDILQDSKETVIRPFKQFSYKYGKPHKNLNKKNLITQSQCIRSKIESRKLIHKYKATKKPIKNLTIDTLNLRSLESQLLEKNNQNHGILKCKINDKIQSDGLNNQGNVKISHRSADSNPNESKKNEHNSSDSKVTNEITLVNKIHDDGKVPIIFFNHAKESSINKMKVLNPYESIDKVMVDISQSELVENPCQTYALQDNINHQEDNNNKNSNLNQKHNFENYYLPMSRKKSILDPENKNVLTSDLKEKYQFFQIDECSYVEMTQNSMKDPISSIIRSGPKSDLAKQTISFENSDYELICETDDVVEPVYMEVSHLNKFDSSSSNDFIKSHDTDILRRDYISSVFQNSKIVNSDTDDESSNGLESLDTSIHKRFSLSDTFRPASYYLGTNKNVIAEIQDSSDTKLVSPLLIPASELNCKTDSLEDHRLLELTENHVPTDESYYDSSKISDSSLKYNKFSGLSMPLSNVHMNRISQSSNESFGYFSLYQKRREKFEVHEKRIRTELSSSEKCYELVSLKNQFGDINLKALITNGECKRNKTRTPTNFKTDKKCFSSEINLSNNNVNISDVPLRNNSRMKNNSVSSLPSLKISEILPCHQHSHSFSGDTHYENVLDSFPRYLHECRHASDRNNQIMQNKTLQMYLSNLKNMHENDNCIKSSTVFAKNDISSNVDHNSQLYDSELNFAPDCTGRNDSSASNSRDLSLIPVIQTTHDTVANSFDQIVDSNLAAPYYYSDLHKYLNTGLYVSNSLQLFAKRLLKSPELNNQRNQRLIRAAKKKEICRLVNPITSNHELEKSDEKNEISVDPEKNSLKTLPGIQRELIKKQTLDEIDCSLKINVNAFSHKYFHHNTIDNWNSKNQTENPTKVKLNHRRSKSLDFSEDFSQNLGPHSLCKINEKEYVHRDQSKNDFETYVRTEYINGDDSWDGDILWQGNLRCVSLHHAKSLDNLDSETNLKNTKEDVHLIYLANLNRKSVENANSSQFSDFIKNTPDQFSKSQILRSRTNDYGLNVNNKIHRDFPVFQESEHAFQDNNGSSSNLDISHRFFEFDREKLRQWDLLSSACLLQEQKSSSTVEFYQDLIDKRIEYEQIHPEENTSLLNETSDRSQMKISENI